MKYYLITRCRGKPEYDVTPLGSRSMKEAIQKSIGLDPEWKAKSKDQLIKLEYYVSASQLHRFDYADAFILEVAQRKELNPIVEETRQEIQDFRNALKEKFKEDAERAEYERLRKKFGNV